MTATPTHPGRDGQAAGAGLSDLAATKRNEVSRFVNVVREG